MAMTLPIAFIPALRGAAAFDGLGDNRRYLPGAELSWEVVGEHSSLGLLPLGKLGAARSEVGLFGLTPLLGLPDNDVQHLLLGQLDRLGTGDFRLADRRQNHPDGARTDLVAIFDCRRQIGAQRCLSGVE